MRLLRPLSSASTTKRRNDTSCGEVRSTSLIAIRSTCARISVASGTSGRVSATAAIAPFLRGIREQQAARFWCIQPDAPHHPVAQRDVPAEVAVLTDDAGFCSDPQDHVLQR